MDGPANVSSARSAAALCPSHQRPAVDTCVRCGDFVCADCRTWLRQRPHCAACAQRLGEQPSKRARLALALSSLGICAGVPAIAGIVLARSEIAAIERGEAPPAGEQLARTARSIGLFYVVAIALAVAYRVLR